MKLKKNKKKEMVSYQPKIVKLKELACSLSDGDCI